MLDALVLVCANCRLSSAQPPPSLREYGRWLREEWRPGEPGQTSPPERAKELSAARGWKAYLTGEEGEEESVEVFCPKCAHEEFGEGL